MSKTIEFKLVSPERILASETAKMVVVPASEGDIGVLAHHIPLLTSLRPGVVTITGEGGEEKRIFLSGGFVDVGVEQCTVLAEDAVNVADLKQADVEQEIADLKEDLDRAEDDLETAKLNVALHIARQKLTAITGEIAA